MFKKKENKAMHVQQEIVDLFIKMFLFLKYVRKTSKCMPFPGNCMQNLKRQNSEKTEIISKQK